MRIAPSRDAYHVIIPAAGMGRRMLTHGTDQPKSLTMMAGRAIIDHSLEILASRGLRRATVVVGYRRRQLVQHLGNRFGAVHIDYVVSRDFDTTEHGWSLYLTREAWERERRPVLFLDADNLYHPDLLDQVLVCEHDNVALVDPALRAVERDEELVLGGQGPGIIARLVRGRTAGHANVVGGFVGINRFNPAFMHALYAYAQQLFDYCGRGLKYERLFDGLIRDTPTRLHYLSSPGARWLNVNHAEELPAAERLAAEIAGHRYAE